VCSLAVIKVKTFALVAYHFPKTLVIIQSKGSFSYTMREEVVGIYLERLIIIGRVF